MRKNHNKKPAHPAHILTILALTAALTSACTSQTTSTESADASAGAQPPAMQSETTDKMQPDASSDAFLSEKPADVPDQTPSDAPTDIPSDTPSQVAENVIDAGAQIPLETSESISAILDEVNSVMGCSVYAVFAVDETNLDAALTNMQESTKDDCILLLVNTDAKTIRICGLNRMENFLGAKAYEKIGDAVEEQLRTGTLEDAVQAFADGLSNEAIQKGADEE